MRRELKGSVVPQYPIEFPSALPENFPMRRELKEDMANRLHKRVVCQRTSR